MVQSEFQENTKMLIVPTKNISDQNHCRIITRTSVCNYSKFQKNHFSHHKLITKGYSSWFKRILKCSWFLQTTSLIKKNCRIITRTSLCNSRNSFRKIIFFQSENKYQGYYSTWSD